MLKWLEFILRPQIYIVPVLKQIEPTEPRARYIYDGVLGAQTAECIESFMRKYPCVVETSNLPDGWREWVEKNLDDHQIPAEDCMGQPCVRITKMYGHIWKNWESRNGVFLFMSTEREMNAFCDAFPECIVNRQPFKTMLEI